MSAEAAALSKTWAVGSHYTVSLTIQKPQPGLTACAVVEWSPSMPGRLTAEERQQYRAGRDAAITELSEAMGLRVALVEV